MFSAATQTERPLDRAQLRAQRSNVVLRCEIALTGPNDLCNRLGLILLEAAA